MEVMEVMEDGATTSDFGIFCIPDVLFWNLILTLSQQALQQLIFPCHDLRPAKIQKAAASHTYHNIYI